MAQLPNPQTLGQASAFNCAIVGANLTVGLNSAPTTLSLDLVEDASFVTNESDQTFATFNGYNGQLGRVYTINFPSTDSNTTTFGTGGVTFHGLLTNHEIKIGSDGRRVSVTLSDGRELLENAQIVIGKYYGTDGVYIDCNSNFNAMSVFRELEPGSSSQFANSTHNGALVDEGGITCGNYTVKKCDETQGHMASGRDKDGMPSISILRTLGITASKVYTPLNSQTIRINFTDLATYMLTQVELTEGGITTSTQARAQYSVINEDSISILGFIERVSEDLGADFTVRMNDYTGLGNYEISIDMIDQSNPPADFALRDFIRDTFVTTELTSNFSYGQEATNADTKRVVFGDHYRYFLSIMAEKSRIIDPDAVQDNHALYEHFQRAPFITNWNNGFGYQNVSSDRIQTIPPDVADIDITGVVGQEPTTAPGSDVPITRGGPSIGFPVDPAIDYNDYLIRSQGYNSNQTSETDLLPAFINTVSKTFPPAPNGEPDGVNRIVKNPQKGENSNRGNCEPMVAHRIFQVLGEELYTRPVPGTTQEQPSIHKLYLTNFTGFDNPGGEGGGGKFQVKFNVKNLLDSLQLNGKTNPGFTLNLAYVDLLFNDYEFTITQEELLMSANYDLYKVFALRATNERVGETKKDIAGNDVLITERKERSVGYLMGEIICGVEAFRDMAIDSLDIEYQIQKERDGDKDAEPIRLYKMSEIQKKQFEFVQQFFKKMYDDYYGKEYAVLLDRREVGVTRKDEATGLDVEPAWNVPDGVVNEVAGAETNIRLATHDICVSNSYKFNTIGSDYRLPPPTTPTSRLDLGYIYGYKVNGDEPNLELSDKISDGAWFSGPNDVKIGDLGMDDLEHFQNGDGTIAGFCYLGDMETQCRRVGTSYFRLLPNLASIDFNSIIIKENLAGKHIPGQTVNGVYGKVTFDNNLFYSKFDAGNADDPKVWPDGGDAIFVRFSVPKIDIRNEFLFIDAVDEEITGDSLDIQIARINGEDTNLTKTEAQEANATFRGNNEVPDDEPDPNKKDGAIVNISAKEFMDMNPMCLIPRDVHIPFESQTQIYGPFSVIGNVSGGTEIVDTDLAPWQFVNNLKTANIVSKTWSDMVTNGQKIALDGLKTRLYEEKASLTVPMITHIDFGRDLQLGQTNLGPLLSNMNLNYGSNGATTSLSFQTYSKEFGKVDKYVRDAIKDLVAVKRDMNLKVRDEKKRRKEIAFRNKVALEDERVSVAENRDHYRGKGKGGKKNSAGEGHSNNPNERSSRSIDGTSGKLIYSSYTLNDGTANACGGENITRKNLIHDHDSSSSDSVTPIATLKPEPNTLGNTNKKRPRSEIKSAAVDHYQTPYYHRVAINSLDSFFLPVSLSGGVPVDDNGLSVDGTRMLPRYSINTNAALTFTTTVTTEVEGEEEATSTTVEIGTVTNLEPGMVISGEGIPQGAVVSSVGANSVTFTPAITEDTTLAVDLALTFVGSANVFTVDPKQGMLSRSFSSIPPLQVTSIRPEPIFDLRINRTFLHPWTATGNFPEMWKGTGINNVDNNRYNGSISGYVVEYKTVGQSVRNFTKGDYIKAIEPGTETVVTRQDRQTFKDQRFNAFRGPLVLQGWGYDTNGKPIPNSNDCAEDTVIGRFRDTGLTDKFMKNWMSNPKTWPVGPIDLRFDRHRGVWVAPTQNKVLLARLVSTLNAFGQAKAELVNMLAGGLGDVEITKTVITRVFGFEDCSTTTIEFEDVSNLSPGMTMEGSNIPENAKIVSVGTNTIEMSPCLTTGEIEADVTITFKSPGGKAYYDGISMWGPEGEDLSADVRNAQIDVYDYLGMTGAVDDLIYVYYDDGKYIVMNQKSAGGGGSATLTPARTCGSVSTGGTFVAQICDGANQFEQTNDIANQITVTDYMNIIPVTIPDDTPIIIAGINEANPCLVSIGKHTSAVGHASSVAGFDFNSNYVPEVGEVPTYFLGIQGTNLVRYRGVGTCSQTI